MPGFRRAVPAKPPAPISQTTGQDSHKAKKGHQSACRRRKEAALELVQNADIGLKIFYSQPKP